MARRAFFETATSEWKPVRARLRPGLTALALAGGVAIGATAIATPASAQATGCGERERMVDHLEAAYGERRLGAGLQSSTGLMELYVSESGSWTLLLTRPDGTSCPVAVGEAWREDQPSPTGDLPA